MWSFWKWYIFLKNYRDHFKKKQEKFPHSYQAINFEIPTYNKHFYRIVSWMMYWPFSALWTLTHKLIRDIFTFISDQLKLAYEKIAGRMFKDIIAEKEAAEKEKNK